jgi:putative chitinase
MIAFSQMQANLKSAGFDPGLADGKWGPHTLSALMGMVAARQPDDLLRSMAVPMAVRLPQIDVTGRLRVLHFLAQACVETDHFRTLTEYGDDAYFTRYDDRADLGNTAPGDGARYKGRGLFNLTGRANYTAAAQVLSLPLGIDPDIAAGPVVATRVAAWYWDRHGCNAMADADNLEAITRAINGGLNGLDQRQEALDRGKAVWGA